MSTGSEEIVIAVLDSGVDRLHVDLFNKLVPGRDTYAVPPDDDPSPGAHWENAHGTACAGLAGAETNNGIGIAGVGWNCKIMPIRVFSKEFGRWWYIPERLIDGIEWATNNGADVLSCSWPELEDNDAIHDAIIYAKDNGRDGKGCVLVFAAHNFNRRLTYPSAYPEVVAVGATDDDDVRWNIGFEDGSNFGPELDVVAPSGWGMGQGVIMWTTDIRGSAGYNNQNPFADPDWGDAEGNYFKWFGGTSAATPEVAGLAALILSVNSELTSDDVQYIIESTADDKGDPGRDNEYGWGRINVYEALYPGGQFRIKDDISQTVARFDNLGNLFLKGTLQQNSNHLPDEYNDEFRFQDWGGNDVMIINTTDGNMYIDGQKHEKQNVLTPGDEDDFIVKNRNGDIVAYVDDSGNLYLKGKLYEHVDP
jgi:subtilisin family serine protease